MHLIFNSTEKIVFLVKLKINFLYIRANWTQNQTVKNPCQYIPKSNPKLFGFNLWLVPEIHLWWLNLNRDQQTDEHPAVFLGCLAHQITEIGWTKVLMEQVPEWDYDILNWEIVLTDIQSLATRLELKRINSEILSKSSFNMSLDEVWIISWTVTIIVFKS